MTFMGKKTQNKQLLTVLPKTMFCPALGSPVKQIKKTVTFSGYTGKDIHWSELVDKQVFQSSLASPF